MSESILLEAERLTSADRNKAYGEPLDNFEHTAALVNAQFGHKLREPFTAEDFAVLMILCKLSRLKTTPTHRDSMTDIAGYARCLQRTVEERARRAAPPVAEVEEIPTLTATA